MHHNVVVKYLKLRPFSYTLDSKDFLVVLPFFSKIKVIFFPDYFYTNFNILNKNTLELLDLRKRFLKHLNSRFRNYTDYQYNVFDSCEDFTSFWDFLENVNVKFDRVNAIFKTKFNMFSLYFVFFFFKKHFSRLFSVLFFSDFKQDNIIKMYFIMYYIFFKEDLSSASKLKIFNLKKFSNWFVFFTKYRSFFILEFFEEKFDRRGILEILPDKSVFYSLLQRKRNYVKFYQTFCFEFFGRKLVEIMKYVRRIRINLNKLHGVVINQDFVNKLQSYTPTRFSESSTNKYVNLSKLDNFIFFFLRKNKIFNKGRYSRNRQTYRTGFYWCLWLNIFVVYGLHFVFYRFIFTFGYLWLFLFIFFSSFIFSRALKYNFISLNFIVNELQTFFIVFVSFCKNIFDIFLNFFKKILDDAGVISSFKRYSYFWFDEDQYLIETVCFESEDDFIEHEDFLDQATLVVERFKKNFFRQYDLSKKYFDKNFGN